MQPAVRGLDVSSVVVPHWFIPIFTDADVAASDHDLPIVIPTPSTWSLSWSKRALDFCTAFLALAMLAVPMLVIAICVRLSSRGTAIFVQKRVGRGGRLFAVYKFRSMAQGASSGPGLTSSGDRRITSFGRVIRKFKLDELPQFYNILRGDMSLVGPRPKLPIYEPFANMPYRPGITGAATLAFRHEEDILGGVHLSQMEHFYAKQIKPLKAQLDLQYMSNATLWSDMCMIASTLLACFAQREIQSVQSVEEIGRKSDSMIA
jgi:lipopolysaccharide/colanic/teichoic acid biosynthesis glycosyltransferase